MSKKKQPKFRILTGKSGDIADFWPLMGPVIASRTVQKEMNDRIFDDENTVWFIAVGQRSTEFMGCCAARVTRKRIILTWGYVVPELRGTSCYPELVKTRQGYVEKEYPDHYYEVSVRSDIHPRLVKQFKKDGFKKHIDRGSYSVLLKNKR